MIYKKKKILFIGTVEFSYKALSTLLKISLKLLVYYQKKNQILILITTI